MTVSFRERLCGGAPLLGTFLRTPSPMLCEVLGRSGLDLVCIDAEHSPFDRRDIDACVMTLRAVNSAAIVRVPIERGTYSQCLDVGATGILVPHVISATQAREIARVAHYGRGGRGFAGVTRAANYGGKTMAEHLRDSAATTTVIVQIDDVEAVEAVEEIATVVDVDALFIGRMDLTVALGCDSPHDPPVIEAVRRVPGRPDAQAHGRHVHAEPRGRSRMGARRRELLPARLRARLHARGRPRVARILRRRDEKA